jgi:hypothetical protein
LLIFLLCRDRASHPRSGVLSVASLCESGFADYETLSLRHEKEQSERVALFHFFLSRIFFLFFCVFFLHY